MESDSISGGLLQEIIKVLCLRHALKKSPLGIIKYRQVKRAEVEKDRESGEEKAENRLLSRTKRGRLGCG